MDVNEYHLLPLRELRSTFQVLIDRLDESTPVILHAKIYPAPPSPKLFSECFAITPFDFFLLRL